MIASVSHSTPVYDNFWNMIIGKVSESGDSVEESNEQAEADRDMDIMSLLNARRSEIESANSTNNLIKYSIIILIIIGVAIATVVLLKKK